MDINEFQEKVKKALMEYGGKDAEVRVSKVRKNNGFVLTGVSMFKKGSNVTPTIYIDDYLRKYEDGMTFGAIMDEIIRMLENYAVDKDFDVSFFTVWDKAKERIVYRLISAEKNEQLLEEVPYIPFLDMAIVFYYLMGDSCMGNASILIYNRHMDSWGIDKELLYKTAEENCSRLLPAAIQGISELMREVVINNIKMKAQENENCNDPGFIERMADELLEQMADAHSQVPMYVLSNEQRYYGAACLLYKDVLKKFAQEQGSDIYILPSSVHETILLPDRGIENPDELRRMVREVNDTQLSPEEVLSDSVYYYDRESGKVSLPVETELTVMA